MAITLSSLSAQLFDIHSHIEAALENLIWVNNLITSRPFLVDLKNLVWFVEVGAQALQCLLELGYFTEAGSWADKLSYGVDLFENVETKASPNNKMSDNQQELIGMAQRQVRVFAFVTMFFQAAKKANAATDPRRRSTGITQIGRAHV